MIGGHRKGDNFMKTILSIAAGSILYAIGTCFFIFPHSITLGGTSGISVILNHFLELSSGKILSVINVCLLLLAFVLLGKSVAVKTVIGSLLTTAVIFLIDSTLTVNGPLIANIYLSGIVGAAIISLASALLFYVDSSSGGTDIIAMIVRKYSKINIGKALFITDILIVVMGALVFDLRLALASFVGFLIKTWGIDGIILVLDKISDKKENRS